MRVSAVSAERRTAVERVERRVERLRYLAYLLDDRKKFKFEIHF
jgi:hypothetical protein